MSQARGSGYAVVLAAAFVLWVPVALFGAQGYSGLIGLTGIAAARDHRDHVILCHAAAFHEAKIRTQLICIPDFGS